MFMLAVYVVDGLALPTRRDNLKMIASANNIFTVLILKLIFIN